MGTSTPRLPRVSGRIKFSTESGTCAPPGREVVGEPVPVVFAPPRFSRRRQRPVRRLTTGYSPPRLRRGPAPPRFARLPRVEPAPPRGAGGRGHNTGGFRAATFFATTPASREALDHRLFSSTPSAWPGAAAFPRRKPWLSSSAFSA